MTSKWAKGSAAVVAGSGRAGPTLQRKCACGTHSTGGTCSACAKKDGLLKRRASGPDVEEVPEIVHEVLRSPGQPLDRETRAFMEPRFGHDFSNVRVHTDARAAESARAVNAHAYTVGRNVVFGAGDHRPSSEAGRRLMAHELTHVVQQSGAAGPVLRGQPRDRFEREADAIASEISRRTHFNVGQETSHPTLSGFWITEEPAGGCGICYDVSGGGPKDAGRVAHQVVQERFMARLGDRLNRLIELPFSAPGDENGRLDLALATPRGIAIGEIKPATPNGEATGINDLKWYMATLQEAYPSSDVHELLVSIPMEGAVMPDAAAAAAGCATQQIRVIMMRPGLYGYFCNPPFSVARSTCPCRRPRLEPFGDRVKEADRRIAERRETRETVTRRAGEQTIHAQLVSYGIPAALVTAVVALTVVAVADPEPISKLGSALASLLGWTAIAATAAAIFIMNLFGGRSDKDGA